MIRALDTAATGLAAQQLNMDVVSNNLANVNTNGYKKVRAEFKDLAYETLKAPGGGADGKAPESLQVGLGVEVSGTQRLFFQGSLTQTSNPLDMAMDGEGFFQVQSADGTTKYTRDGSFQIDGEGRLTTAGGNVMEPAITIPSNAQDIQISPDGAVMVVMSGESDPTEVGRIETVHFANPAGLKAIGENLYEATAACGDAVSGNPGSDGRGALRQGFLEASNVQVVEEMVRMLTAQRAFEANSKALQAADDMLRAVNNLKV
jgi:flagellar basal-body rod protein FlgG